MTKTRTLISPIHFHTAALDRAVILVFQDGELIGSGRISEITDSDVKIRDEYFVIENCTFQYAWPLNTNARSAILALKE
ncbi:hypothetical protein M6D81_11510 [Paenibacillus sp. J5C_2022]|uniref:hypothetical protein n=1 Tax=Paenibacillus sp. J5C2022 TaxID=2977129 RepID=UPI0021D24098|nr:hypothetical protein [Paenibacillus sp. J5C2022]MCU6709334.1 hypothetical protein [Paenibacillus sp. J5C2022]